MNSVGNISYYGGVDRQVAVGWFSKNRVLMHMNKLYKEPFGLAPVEAQACGMPVIAFDNGAMRETIKHGETGFLVKSENEVVEILRNGFSFNPNRCREWASQFSVQNMILRYENLLKEGIDKGW
jgi:glycosyltransferase involved in cell wall biosynthesis